MHCLNVASEIESAARSTKCSYVFRLQARPVGRHQRTGSVLRDQYDAASIPKELVQNVDDADAKRLHFTWAAGWSNHRHPLLRVPALVVPNDGAFKEEDAEAIQYLRLGYCVSTFKGQVLTA